MGKGDILDVLAGEAHWCVQQGDCLEVLGYLEDDCVDAVVTDPPAGIEFMGKAWDRFKAKEPVPSGQQTEAWDVHAGTPFARQPTPKPRGKTGADLQPFQDFITAAFTEVYRVLKPGGHALVWALPRTSHHTMMGLERFWVKYGHLWRKPNIPCETCGHSNTAHRTKHKPKGCLHQSFEYGQPFAQCPCIAFKKPDGYEAPEALPVLPRKKLPTTY